MDPRDPDLEDLREEFRPKLRERFDGWVNALSTMKGGHGMLGKLYFKIVEEMPYFKVNDVAEEMLNRSVHLLIRGQRLIGIQAQRPSQQGAHCRCS
jgi:hypothetical protein